MEQTLAAGSGTATAPMRRTQALAPGSVTRHTLDNGLVVLVYPSANIPALTTRLSSCGTLVSFGFCFAHATTTSPNKSGAACDFESCFNCFSAVWRSEALRNCG